LAASDYGTTSAMSESDEASIVRFLEFGAMLNSKMKALRVCNLKAKKGVNFWLSK
jgi:hypothetical protein